MNSLKEFTSTADDDSSWVKFLLIIQLNETTDCYMVLYTNFRFQDALISHKQHSVSP